MEGSGPKEKARLLPPAQEKKGDLWRPLGGAGGGKEGREGKGRQGGTQLSLLLSKAEVEPLPAAPCPLTLPPASLT